MANRLHFGKVFRFPARYQAFSTLLNGAATRLQRDFRHESSDTGHAEVTQILREGTSNGLPVGPS